MTYKTFGIFFAGVAVGAAGCYFALRVKFEKQLNEQVDVINQAFDREMEKLGLEITKEKKEAEDPVNGGKIFRTEIKKHGYETHFKTIKEDSPKMEEMESPKEGGSVEPYIISAEQFATDGILDKVTLTYYINADLVCEEEEILDNFQNIIGTDFVNHFHDDEEGVVYVRNERLGTDYEVILDDSDGEFIRARFGFAT